MSDLVTELEKKFGGSKEAQANTLSGSIEGVKLAWDELSESFGKGLTLGTAGTGANTIEQMQKVEQQLRNEQRTAENLGGTIHDTAMDFANFVDVAGAVGELWDRGQRMDAIKLMFETDAEAARATARAVRGVGGAMDYMTAKAKLAGIQADKTKRAFDRLGAAGFTASTSIMGGETWDQIDERLRGARLTQAWADTEAANRRRRQRQQDAARKRAEARAKARAKKKADRLNAVRNAKDLGELMHRANARTGTDFSAQVMRHRKACA